MAKRYKSVDAGVKALGASPQMGKVALQAAREIEAAANRSNPKGKYEASPKTVLAGWANDRRAGATVRETGPAWRGARERTLTRVAGLMGRRGSM